MTFKADQIAFLAKSGWARRPVADLPSVTSGYLGKAFTAEQWRKAEAAVTGLRERFAGARFAEETTYGVLLVPDPAKLDTRRPVARQQLGDDFFDERLPAGTLGARSGTPWTMVATVTGQYGPSLGSYTQVKAAPESMFTVGGIDTRRMMTRQVWGARVLQGGNVFPDCESNEHWTFTLFPGEELVDGFAESGTVLKGKVRFRLGKPDRGIVSARVAPGILIR
jgi:hypothetical protein